MLPVKKLYLESFLQSLLDTLENKDKLENAIKAYGENNERYKATETFDFSGWPEEDKYNFSAAYFEAIASASEQCKDLDRGAEMAFECQLYVQKKIVPDFIQCTDNESRFETIKGRIKAKQQGLKDSDSEESLVSTLGLFGGVAAVAVVGALALGAVKYR